MMLSTEQTRAVMHGIDNKFIWRFVDRPVGPQPLPDWVKGAAVNWHDDYSNSPSVRLIVDGDVREWEGKRFRKEGHHYRAYHDDGRLEQYAHNGPVSPTEIQRFRADDGTLWTYRREGSRWATGADSDAWMTHSEFRDGKWVQVPYGWEPGEWVKVMLPATTAQGGFGGAQIPLLMEDGSELILRGPWHVGAPAGYAEVSYQMRGERWGGRAGLYITLDLFTRIMARFQPHLELAEVTYGGGTTIEPMKPEWDVPKRIIYERQWQDRKDARDAARAGAS